MKFSYLQNQLLCWMLVVLMCICLQTCSNAENEVRAQLINQGETFTALAKVIIENPQIHRIRFDGEPNYAIADSGGVEFVLDYRLNDCQRIDDDFNYHNISKIDCGDSVKIYSHFGIEQSYLKNVLKMMNDSQVVWAARSRYGDLIQIGLYSGFDAAHGLLFVPNEIKDIDLNEYPIMKKVHDAWYYFSE